MNSQEYEVFIGKLIELLSQNDLIISPGISHLKKLRGKSGEVYEIDLCYTFRVAEADYITLVECKNWNRRVGRNIVSAFRSTIEDIGAHKGIICTTVGFQKGAIGLATKTGIGLFKITDEFFLHISRFEGPKQDIEKFLLKKSPKYSGGDIKTSEGMTTARFSIIDYVSVNYGEEVAAFLAHEEIKSINQIKECDFKENLNKQILTMGKSWIDDYLKIESCGMPIIVEPLNYFRMLNQKIYYNWIELRKSMGLSIE